MKTNKNSTAMERIVQKLSDNLEWNWCYMTSWRSAADRVLRMLANEKLIEFVEHPSGGKIWRVNGKLFGRTDHVTHKKFDKLKNKL